MPDLIDVFMTCTMPLSAKQHPLENLAVYHQDQQLSFLSVFFSNTNTSFTDFSLNFKPVLKVGRIGSLHVKLVNIMLFDFSLLAILVKKSKNKKLFFLFQ